MARFKGIDKTEFLDNRQPQGHAFALLDEAMTFLHRHLPLSGRFESGRLERIDELLFPTAALREALVNALCHRDYAIYGGAVSVAVFDDRVEIWSDGTLPFGLRPRDLKHKHGSHPRNPLITDTFYRRGLIEQWGRGTNRIVELTVKAGHPEPEFTEIAGSVIVCFRPKSGSITDATTPTSGAEAESRPESRPEWDVSVRMLQALFIGPRSRAELATVLGHKGVSGAAKRSVKALLEQGLMEYTLPAKPQSRLQKYRLTDKGRAALVGAK